MMEIMNSLDIIQTIQHNAILHYKAAYLKRTCNFLHYSLVINKRPPRLLILGKFSHPPGPY